MEIVNILNRKESDMKIKFIGEIDERFSKDDIIRNQCDVVFQMEYENCLYLIGIDESDYSTITLDFIGDNWQDLNDEHGLIESGFYNQLEQTMVELGVA